MTDPALDVRRIVDRMPRLLPLSVRPRPELAASICKLSSSGSAATSYIVKSVIYARPEHGIMCGLERHDAFVDPTLIVASITHLTFDRRHPLSREIAAYRKRRLEDVVCAQSSSAENRKIVDRIAPTPPVLT